MTAHAVDHCESKRGRRFPVPRTAARGGDAIQVELTQLMVVFHHGTLPLEHRDGHSLLIVLISGESLRFLRGDETALGDDFGHHTAHGFDTQSQRSGVDDDQTLGFFAGVPANNTTLNSGSESHSLVRVDAGVGLLAIEHLLHQLSDFGDSGGASHQNDFVDLVLLQSRVFQSQVHRVHGVLEQISVQLLEFGSGKLFRKVQTLK